MRRGSAMLGLMGIVPLVGCDALPPLAGPLSTEGLPPVLKHVVDRREAFSTAWEDPLFTRALQTTVEDPSVLEGCWGTARLPVVDVPAADRPLVAVYAALRIDPGGERFEHWVLQDDAFGIAVIAQREEGRLRLAEEVLRFEDGRGEVYAYRPGRDGAMALEPLETFARPAPLELIAILEGDRLRLRNVRVEADHLDPLDDEVYIRFACPRE